MSMNMRLFWLAVISIILALATIFLASQAAGQGLTLEEQLEAMHEAVEAVPRGSAQCPPEKECPPPVVCKECPVCPDPVVEPYPVECPDNNGSVVVVEKIVEVPLVPRDSDLQAMIDMAKSIGIRTEIDRSQSGTSISWTYPEWIRQHMGATDGMRGYMHYDYSNGSVP